MTEHPIIFEVEVTSLIGAIDAEHYYVEARKINRNITSCSSNDPPEKQYCLHWEVEHPMSAKEAKLLNKKDNEFYSHQYDRNFKGDMTTRFTTREAAENVAIKFLIDKFGADIKIRGRGYFTKKDRAVIYDGEK